MSGGTDSIQINKGKDSLALLAKAWATPLLCHLTWEKEQVWKQPIRDLQSLIICPIYDQSGHSPTKAFTRVSESPSKMALCNPNSSMKIIALLAAIALRISTVGGMAIFSAKDTITCPSSFLTTMPKPAASSSAK